MTIRRPVRGSTANWMFEPPVATPTVRMTVLRVVAHRLVLDVGQRHLRRHRDRVARVDPHRVEVLDGADDDARVRRVAHQLQLELLPAEDRLLDEDLVDRREEEAALDDRLEVVGIEGDPAPGAAEGVGGADDDGEAEGMGDLAGLVDRPGHAGPQDVDAGLLHRLLEEEAVLPELDGVGRGAEELDAVLREGPVLVEGDGEVQGRLAADGRQEGVGALLRDDPLDGLDVERLDVGRIGELRVRHDRGGVRVDQDDPVPLASQDAARLGPGVVELARLADDDRPGAEDQDRLQVGSLRHAPESTGSAGGCRAPGTAPATGKEVLDAGRPPPDHSLLAPAAVTFSPRPGSWRSMKLPSGLSFDHVPELQALWAELSEMRLVLGGLPVLVSAVDKQGLFAYWNRECERVTGYTSPEVLGNAGILELLFPDPIQKARMEELWRSPDRAFRDVETELTTKYGSARTVSWSSLSSTYPVEGWDLWAVGVDRTEAKRNEQVLSLLAEVNSRLLQREPLASIHSFICHRVADIFRFALVSIGQRHPDGSVRMSGIAGPNAPGASAQEIRWDVPSPTGGITGAAIRTGLVQRAEAERDSSFGVAWRNLAAGRKIGASIALPLTARGTVLGALTVHARRPDAFDPKTVDILLRLTQQVSLSFDQAADLTEIQLQSLALDAVRHSVVITARDGTIEWVNPAFSAMSGFSREDSVGKTPRIQRSGHHGTSFYADLWGTILSGRTWEGETTNLRKDGSVYVEDQTITPVKDEAGEITHFVAVKRDVTERRRYEDAIVHLARHDPLTDLPNRRVVEENLARLVARAGRRLSSALLLVDLDNFKEINDRAGHAAGDEVLRAFARLFLDAVRPGDLVGRIGGDEFVVLLEGAGAEEARAAAERIRDRATTVPLPEGYAGPPIGASVGVALVPGHQAPGEVLATADAALYEGKSLGKGLVVVLEHPAPPRSGGGKKENSGRIRLDDALRRPAGRGSRP